MVHLNRAGDARYAGSAFVLKTSSDTDNVYLTLSHSETLRRDQRRLDFRVDESRTICLWVVEESEREEIIVPRSRRKFRNEPLCDDISAGGACYYL